MTFFEYYRDRNNQDVLYLHGKNLSYNNHFHKSLEILYCVENKMEIILENKSYVIKKGEAFCCEPKRMDKKLIKLYENEFGIVSDSFSI